MARTTTLHDEDKKQLTKNNDKTIDNTDDQKLQINNKNAEDKKQNRQKTGKHKQKRQRRITTTNGVVKTGAVQGLGIDAAHW